QGAHGARTRSPARVSRGVGRRWVGRGRANPGSKLGTTRELSSVADVRKGPRSSCAVKTAHRLEFTRVEVEEILRLSARKAAASTAQARIARRLATPSRPSRPDGLAWGRAGQTDRHAT